MHWCCTTETLDLRYPARAKKLPPFDRRITQDEYDAVLSYLYLLELDNGYTQDFSAASADYIPAFNFEGL